MVRTLPYVRLSIVSTKPMRGEQMSYKNMKLEILLRLIESEFIALEQDPEERLALYEHFACMRDFIYQHEVDH